MCGIAGVVNLRGERADSARLKSLAEAMSGTLLHRGPDDSGAWESPGGDAALAHRRLSIVDLSPLGRNPMLWEGGRLAITFNGEIYNFLELRRELEGFGHKFRSQTDTEVILAAYDQWGVDCVHRFAGMFAFALWDEPRRRLWVVRDRLGKKPLYYAQAGGLLLFGSELKAIVNDPAFPRTIDREAVQLYLRYGYIPAPYTIFKAARKLEPAHFLVCEGGRVSVTRYWDALGYTEPSEVRSEQDAEAHLESLLAVAVRQRLIADVPLGAFLSGGIDSSLVVALMQEHSRDPVKTFTIRFADPQFNEADHARAVAVHLKTDHHEELCDERQMLAIVDRLPDMFDEPFGDSSAIPTYLVSAVARKQVTVALSGDGGDEVFFGYPRYRFHAMSLRLLALPGGVRRLLAAVASRGPTRRVRRVADVLRSNDPDTYARFVAWQSTSEVARTAPGPGLDAPLYRDMLSRGSRVEGELLPSLLDIAMYLPDDILAKVDRASMAVSLEVRAPLLDHRVVEFALGLPLSLKRRGGTMKWLLRRLLYKRVPRELIDRPKMGFGVPLGAWFRGVLRDQMDDYCRGADLENLDLDPAPIREMWRGFKEGQYHRPDLLWQAFVLMAWSRRFQPAALPASTSARR